ncbi:hypothetical protein DFJ74DRAFT_210697 [Hyaloraphidium curvatum]|nr:hypothetical protein DFJ74DRAFT_210697 [Hyaloraphidium curvatum]
MDSFDTPDGYDMLRQMVGGLPDTGVPHLELLVHIAGLEHGRQARWCAAEAGMSTTEVLAAECAGRMPAPTRGLAKRAVHRMARLREAMAGLEAAVPRTVAAPFRAGDLAGLRAMFGEGFRLHEALGFLTHMQMLRMLGVSPEPFVDLAEEVEYEHSHPERHSEDSGSSVMSSALVTNTESDPDTVESALNALQLSVWFSSTNYATATRAADAVCTGIRTFLRSSTPEQIKGSVYTIIFCIAATHGSWIRLLELRHACRSGAQSSADLERCASLLDDVSACVAVLRASGMPHCAATADTIAAFLDGERTAISRTDLLGLRMARVVARVCPHGDAAEGGCWACATEVPDRRAQAFPGKVFHDDSLAAGIGDRESDLWQGGSEGPTAYDGSPVPSASKLRSVTGSGRQRAVTFSSEVKIGETYHKDDYRGRSMFAETEMHEVVDAEGEAVGLSCWAARGGNGAADACVELPDLKMYWPAADPTRRFVS